MDPENRQTRRRIPRPRLLTYGSGRYLLEIEALPDGHGEGDRLQELPPRGHLARSSQMRIPAAGFCALLQQHLQLHDQVVREHRPYVQHSADHGRYPLQQHRGGSAIRELSSTSAPSSTRPSKQLEELTGKKFDEKKFEQACKPTPTAPRKAWLKVCDLPYSTSPLPTSGFDLFNHMADVVVTRARGMEAAAEAFELLWPRTLQETIEEGRDHHAAVPGEIPRNVRGHPLLAEASELCSSPSRRMASTSPQSCTRPRSALFTTTWTRWPALTTRLPNSVCIEQGVAWREGICRDNKVDGVLVHYNRSCKPWSGYMAEMQRRFTADLGVPCAGFRRRPG